MTYFINDIRDLLTDKCTNLLKRLEKLNTIYHLAALARIQESLKNPTETISVNDYGTLQIAELARRFESKVVYASTSAIEGGYFLNPYVFSKWIGKEHFRLFNKLYKLKTGITRFFNVYGSRHPTAGPYVTVVSVFEQQYLKNIPLTITSDGEQRRDFIHVFDICNGLIEIGKGEWNCDIFNLGTATNFSINELAALFFHDITYIPAREGEMRETLADISFTQLKLNGNQRLKLKIIFQNGWKKTRGLKFSN